MKPAVDSSVAIAAFASWHDLHEQALKIVNAGASLPAHAGFETYSVLTRLPEPTRARPKRVCEFLRDAFPDDWLTLPATSLAELVLELADRDISGGATYDALIAATVRAAGTALVTCDRRARTTYERMGVRVEFVS